MKKSTLAFIALSAAALVVGLFSGHTASATDDEYSCPAGTVFEYKVEPLSGKTFTVPTPPTGWTVEAVILKVGGPGGGSHITFNPVTPGQVLSVANQQYDISHAHICKGRPQSTTTTTTTLPEEETTTTSSTTTTTTLPEETTTTTICVDCTPNTQVTIPATTTTVEEETTTTTTVALTDPPVPSTTLVRNPLAPFDPSPTTTTTVPALTALPVTGSDEAQKVLPWAALVLGLGGIGTLVARRPKV